MNIPISDIRNSFSLSDMKNAVSVLVAQLHQNLLIESFCTASGEIDLKKDIFNFGNRDLCYIKSKLF